MNLTRNQNYLVRLLDLIQKLSVYEEMNREIVENGLGYHLHIALKENINEVDILEQLLRIFTNLLYLEENTQHYFNMGIIFTLNKILNSYKNSILAKEHIIIKCCIYCLTTFTDGNINYMKMLLDLNIPKTIMQISKIKNDNEIYYEALEFFHSFLSNGNDNFVIILFSSVSLLEIFCKGLNLSGKDDFILLCLKCILILFKRNNKIYSTTRNLKIEFYGCCGAKNIERLLTHKNQEICDHASKIQEYIENNNTHQNGINNYNKIII